MNPALKHAILLLAACATLGVQAAPGTTRPSAGMAPPTSGPALRSPSDRAPSSRSTSRPASRPRRTFNEEFTKYSPTFLKTLSPLAEKARASIAVISINGHDIYATVVRADGYLVTKASELKAPTFDVRLSSGATLKGKIVGCAVDHDLALVQVPTTNLVPIEWADPATLKLGEIVIAPGDKPQPIGWGVLSVLKRPTSGGIMGIMFPSDPNDTSMRVESFAPVSPAQKAGMKAGDVITKIDGHEFAARYDLQEYLAVKQAGKEVIVTVKRGDAQLDFHITLMSRGATGGSARSDIQNTGGNALTLSDRRADFPAVLEHDIVLYPTQQGGPLLNLEGKAIGINIARAGRVETYATPAEVVQQLLPDLIKGKYPPTTHPVEVAQAPEPQAPGAPAAPSADASPKFDKETNQAMLDALKRRIEAKKDELARGTNMLKAMEAELQKRLALESENAPSTHPTTRP
jgi:serine protease Do